MGIFTLLFGGAGYAVIRGSSALSDRADRIRMEEVGKLRDEMLINHSLTREEWIKENSYVFQHAKELAEGYLKKDIDYVFGAKYVWRHFHPDDERSKAYVAPPDKPIPYFTVEGALARLYVAKKYHKFLPSDAFDILIGGGASRNPYSFRLFILINRYIGRPEFELIIVPSPRRTDECFTLSANLIRPALTTQGVDPKTRFEYWQTHAVEDIYHPGSKLIITDQYYF